MSITVGTRCKLCLRAWPDYQGYCYECAELMDQLHKSRARMKRWLNVRKPCGCVTCLNQEQRDRHDLDDLIAIAVEVKKNGW